MESWVIGMVIGCCGADDHCMFFIRITLSGR